MHTEHCSGYHCLSTHTSNPVPKMRYPTKTHHSFSSTVQTTTDAIKTLFTSTFGEKNDTNEFITSTISSEVPETTIANVLGTDPSIAEENTAQQVIDAVTQAITEAIDSSATSEDAILNQGSFNNNSAVVGVTEVINNTGIFETTDTDSSTIMNTDLFTTTKYDQASTILSDFVTNTTEKVTTAVHTTTETLMDIFTSTVTAEKQYDHGDEMKHFNSDAHHYNIIYIILGIILGILLIICTTSIIIYIRYRKSKSHSLLHHPYYNVDPRRETVPTYDSSLEQEVVNDVYVQYTC